jgi:hypothetical protein
MIQLCPICQEQVWQTISYNKYNFVQSQEIECPNKHYKYSFKGPNIHEIIGQFEFNYKYGIEFMSLPYKRLAAIKLVKSQWEQQNK